MIGAIDFMYNWYDDCKKLISCDTCYLRDRCRGAMARLTRSDILSIISLVTTSRKEKDEKAGDNKS